MFWRNLNVFLMAWILVCVFAAPVFTQLLEIPLRALGATGSFYLVAPYVLAGAVLVAIWMRWGLAPAQIRPDRAKRYRTGMGLLGFSNAWILATFVLPMVVATVSGIPEMQLFGFYMLPVMALAFILGPVGMIMVFTAGT